MKFISLLAMLLLCSFASALHAQETPFPEPDLQHQWLHQFVGNWDTKSVAAGPWNPEMNSEGTVSSRMLGGFWIVSDYQAVRNNSRMTAVQSIGFDSQKNKYVGTWIDSTSNRLWKYEGELDNTGKILTLEAEGPNFLADGKLTKFRDTIEFKSPDEIVLSSSMLGEDGKWITYLTGKSVRKKAVKQK